MKTHYAATAIPALLAATVYGVARIGDRDRRTSPRSQRSPALSRSAASAASTSTPGRTTLRRSRALAVVPEGAPVSATNALGAHLSGRRRVFSFPVLREADWVAVDSTRLTYLDSLRPGRARPALAALRRDPNWRLVFAEDGVLVFRKR